MDPVLSASIERMISLVIYICIFYLLSRSNQYLCCQMRIEVEKSSGRLFGGAD